MTSRIFDMDHPGVTQILLAGTGNWLEIVPGSLRHNPHGEWMGITTPTFVARVMSPKGDKEAEICGPVSSIAAVFSPDMP